MFAIEKYQRNGFDQVLLKDMATQTSVAIIPGCGAMLHAFQVWENNVSLNVIDSYASRAEFDEKAEGNGFKGLKLSPFPCRIPDGVYRFDNREYRFKRSLHNGAAIHGLLYRQPFKIIQEQASELGASVSLAHDYRAADDGYPFAYRCVVTYRLETANTLCITTLVTNTGVSPMPLADGWHPYFTLGKKVNDLELQFQAKEILEFADLIPTGRVFPYSAFSTSERIGETELDNSFMLDFRQPQPLCILRDPVSGWQVTIQPEQSYPVLQIYIPPHRNSIAIENLSAPPDSFNNGMGLLSLTPDGQVSFVTRYSIGRR